MINSELKLALPKTPLENFSLFQDEDVDTLESTSDDWFSACRLLTTQSVREHSRTSAYATQLGPVKLVYAESFGTELIVEYKKQEPNIVIMFAIGGVSRVQVGHDHALCADHHAAVISPDMIPRLQLSEQYSQLHLRIDRVALERHLENMIGVPIIRPIRFKMSMDLQQPAIASWMQTIQLLVQDLHGTSGLSTIASDLDPWSDFLMTGLLLAQPHNYTHLLSRPKEQRYQPPSLKRAIELIQRDPSAPLSVDDLSAVARVSNRTIQREFREYLGATPSEYLQWTRLQGAHEDLLSQQGETVTEIALRWGFTHTSRFSAIYRSRYGQLPSETLREANFRTI